MARLPQPGGDNGDWGTILNDFLRQIHTTDGTLKDDVVGSDQLQDNSVTANTIAPGAVTKTTVGLTNVDNTADEAKPVSIAQQAALDAKLNTADLDAQAANRITMNGTAIQTALNVAFGRRDGVYVPSPTAALRWRQIRSQVLTSQRQAHIGLLGDSIGYGAAATGASQPKPRKVTAGLLRTELSRRFGASGGGFTNLDNVRLFGSIADDTRFAKSAGVITHTFGPHATNCWRANAGSDYIDFTETCTEFWIYTISGGNQIKVSIDSAADITLLNTASASGVSSDIAPEAGYFRDTANIAHNVFKIPAGSLGSHTIRIKPNPTTGTLFLSAVEGRIPTVGTFRVGNLSTNGKALSTFMAYTDESQGLYAGIVWLDTFKPDLLLLALGLNDWQSQISLVTSKARLITLIDRQRGTGTSAYGSTKNGGDVVLMWHPKPDIATLGGGAYTNPSWDAYRNMFYEVAKEKDCCLIDFGDMWGGTYAAAQARGLFADNIHPSDAGYLDLEGSLAHALFDVI